LKNLSIKHDNHTVEIGPGSGPHYASLRCKDCNVHIAWLSKHQFFIAARHIGVAAIERINEINEIKELNEVTK
jgi:hypothetical protein